MIQIGWSSATSIFDAAVEAAYALQRESLTAETQDQLHKAIIKFAKVMRDQLEEGDWDCQPESDFWELLAKDLWPEDWAEHLKWQEDE